MIQCLNAGGKLVDGFKNTWTAITTDFSVDGILDAFDIALDPIYHLADINLSCFVGAQEAYG
jgi:hypothetical protein